MNEAEYNDKVLKDMAHGMVDILNEAIHAYYILKKPIMTDERYDIMFGDLKDLEKTTGYILPNSPTHNRLVDKVNESV